MPSPIIFRTHSKYSRHSVWCHCPSLQKGRRESEFYRCDFLRGLPKEDLQICGEETGRRHLFVLLFVCMWCLCVSLWCVCYHICRHACVNMCLEPRGSYWEPPSITPYLLQHGFSLKPELTNSATLIASMPTIPVSAFQWLEFMGPCCHTHPNCRWLIRDGSMVYQEETQHVIL